MVHRWRRHRPSFRLLAISVVCRFSRSPLQPFAKWETDMSNLQDTILHDAAAQTALLLPPAPGEPRALIAILSTAKRHALVACFNGSGLHKKNGAWHGLPNSKPVSGVTVADLARDGMLTLTMDHRLGSARLTERGNWFARTLLREATAARE
jgi:hypothetical protein